MFLGHTAGERRVCVLCASMCLWVSVRPSGLGHLGAAFPEAAAPSVSVCLCATARPWPCGSQLCWLFEPQLGAQTPQGL